jgi:hypothetical protein
VAHVFLDGHNKRVYDPSQVPGLNPGPRHDLTLSGADPHHQNRPWSSFKPAALVVQPEHDALEGTFPDSPSFYPGMIFSVPVAVPSAPQPASARQSYEPAFENNVRREGLSVWVETQLPVQLNHAAPTDVRGRPSNNWGVGGETKVTHGWFQGEEKEVGGRRSRMQRDEATKRQEVYRRELDEQVTSRLTQQSPHFSL